MTTQTELARCGCGEIPSKLHLSDAGQGGKWAHVAGDCYDEWELEFRTDYEPLDSDKCMNLAIDAWNNATRKTKSDIWMGGIKVNTREQFEIFFETIKKSIPQKGYKSEIMDAAYCGYLAGKAASDDKADAERYRFLRQHGWYDNGHGLCVTQSYNLTIGDITYTREFLDTEIDTAMGEKK